MQLLDYLHMLFAFAFSVNEDIIEVYYHKNVEFLYQDLINIALECNWYISQFKRHDLILEVAMVGLEGHLSFVAFSDPDLMIGIS